MARMLNKSVNRTIIEVCIYRDNIDPLDKKEIHRYNDDGTVCIQ